MNSYALSNTLKGAIYVFRLRIVVALRQSTKVVVISLFPVDITMQGENHL